MKKILLGVSLALGLLLSFEVSNPAPLGFETAGVSVGFGVGSGRYYSPGYYSGYYYTPNYYYSSPGYYYGPSYGYNSYDNYYYHPYYGHPWHHWRY